MLTPAGALAILGGEPAVAGLAPQLPVSDEEERAVLASLRNTPLTTLYGGYDVGRLEAAFGERFGYPHCVAMSSGTSSLHAAVVAAGVRAGDEVIVPALSFVATVSVVVQQGAVPVFCDADPDDLGMDVAQVERLVTPRTRAVVMVHLYGMPMKIEALARLCAERGIALVEDCACAPASRSGGRYVGSFGVAGCFSFNVHKVLRTGEGGMAVTRDPAVAERLRELRVNGLGPRGGVNAVAGLGFNYTMPQALAAMGVVQVGRTDELLARRRENDALFREGVRDLPFRFPQPREGVEPVPYMTPFLLDPEYAPFRDRVLRAAQAEGIAVNTGYGEPLPRIGYLRPFAEGRRFPVADDVAARLFSVDPAPYYTPAQMEAMAAGFRKVFAHLHQLPEAAPAPSRHAAPA